MVPSNGFRVLLRCTGGNGSGQAIPHGLYDNALTSSHQREVRPGELRSVILYLMGAFSAAFSIIYNLMPVRHKSPTPKSNIIIEIKNSKQNQRADCQDVI